MIAEREREIKAFAPREYWTIEGIFTKKGEYTPFLATLNSIKGERLNKYAIEKELDALEIIEQLQNAKFHIGNITKRDIKRNPPPPFITSTLQQEASRKLGFSAKKTMSVAQKLYEGKEVGDTMVGLITYMRTDSTNMASSALVEAKKVITDLYGENFALEKPRIFAKKAKGAQEAHEAIRPTSLERTPKSVEKYLNRDEFRLYELIWKRTIASQMSQMILESVSADIESDTGYTFRTTGSTVKFPGYSMVYLEGKDDEEESSEPMLPLLTINDELAEIGIVPEQHFTSPPPRYSEATLIKALEEYGIGRPSTYAGIINTLQVRKYVVLKDRRFYPEDVGLVVSDLLTKHFEKYVDYEFTAHMEEDLDNVATGKIPWQPMIKSFWDPFQELLKRKDVEVKKEEITIEPTDKTCPKCEKPVVKRLGKYGKFYACSDFPNCTYVASLEGKTDEIPENFEACEKCGKPMQVKIGKFGPFLGCTGYPDCKNIRSLKKPLDTNVTCPECHVGTMIERVAKKGKGRGRVFYGCSNYPKCTHTMIQRPYSQPCPQCGAPFLSLKKGRFGEKQLICNAEGCGYSRDVDDSELERIEKRERG